MKTKVNSDVILGILLIVVSAAIFLTANTYPAGAALYPKGLAILIAILSISIVWTGIKKGVKEAGEPVTLSLIKMPVIVYLFMVAYIAGFRILGFFVATPIFIFSVLSYLKGGSWKRCLATALIFTVICYIGFVVIMGVPIYRIGLLGGLFRWTF